MKKYGFWALLLMLMLVLAFPVMGHAAAATTTHINLNGSELTLPQDAQVQIVKGSVMVPLRLVTEQLGFGVKWDNATKTAIIEQGGRVLKLVVNQATAEAAGRQVKLDNPPFLNGSTTLVPLRFIGEETGATVGWDNVTKTVYLTSPAQEIGSGGGTDPGTPAVPDASLPVSPDRGTDVKDPSGSAVPGAAVTDMSFTDNKLIIAVNGSVTPSVFTMTGKDRIVIDLPNTGFEQVFGQNLPLGAGQSGQMPITDYPDVSAVRYSLFSSSPSAVRIVLDLNSAKNYSVINANDGLIIIDLNGTSHAGATPAPTPAPTIDPTSPDAPVTPPPVISGKKLIVIDAGHGGKDPGAISLNKRKEKDFTLAVALKIEALLKNEPNIEFMLTRSGDTYPTLQERAKLANDMNAALFVSIHANSVAAGSKNNPSGTETYYTRKESLQFAEVVHKYFVPATGLPDRGVHKSSLHVTRETKMPAILLECGYLSNPQDEALLYTDEFQQRVAEAVVAGMKEYLGL